MKLDRFFSLLFKKLNLENRLVVKLLTYLVQIYRYS